MEKVLVHYIGTITTSMDENFALLRNALPPQTDEVVFQSAVIYFIVVYVHLCHSHLITLSPISWISQPIWFHKINTIQYRCPFYLLVFCPYRYRLVIDTTYDKGNVLRGLLKGNTVSKHSELPKCPEFVPIQVLSTLILNSTEIDSL